MLELVEDAWAGSSLLVVRFERLGNWCQALGASEPRFRSSTSKTDFTCTWSRVKVVSLAQPVQALFHTRWKSKSRRSFLARRAPASHIHTQPLRSPPTPTVKPSPRRLQAHARSNNTIERR